MGQTEAEGELYLTITTTLIQNTDHKADTHPSPSSAFIQHMTQLAERETRKLYTKPASYKSFK